jgi:streptogramin lyase/drug/metabolite transporter superfamily protein YnfA
LILQIAAFRLTTLAEVKLAGSTISAHRTTSRQIIAMLTAVALSLCVALPAAADAQAPKVYAFKLKVPGFSGLHITSALSQVPSQRERVKVKYTVPVTVTVTVTVTTTVKHKGTKKKETKREKRTEKKTETRTKFVTETFNAKQDWVVLTGAAGTEVVSVTPERKIGVVATGLQAPTTAPPGQTSLLPTYGSVEADGHVWVLDYSAPLAPLYAISPSGQLLDTATLTGDLTDMTAGPDNTIVVTDNAGDLDRCAITKRPHASCKVVPAPIKFDGGQVDAVGQGGGRVWFTDDAGELASFNPSRGTFAGPYGDISTSAAIVTGEASADPGTIAAAPNGRMYVAAGEGSDALFENDLIRAINPRSGARLGSFSHGLTNVVAMTVGSDGNVWFVNETNAITGTGTVGVLDTVDGALRQYKLPAGYRLPPSGVSIDPGPVGSDTVFFTLQTSLGANAALGEVTGI